MPRSFLAAALLTALACAAGAQTPVPTYIVAGQSNAEGWADPANLTGTPFAGPQAGVLIWNDLIDVWQPLEAGVNTQTTPYDGNLQQFGPEMSLADSLKTLHPGETVHVFKLALDGSFLESVPATPLNPTGGFNDWSMSSTNELYDLLLVQLAAANAALAPAETMDVRGVFWVQGASDSYLEFTSAAYQANLTQFIAGVRGDLFANGQTSDPSVPFVLSHVGHYLFFAGGVLLPPPSVLCTFCYLDTVRSAEQLVAYQDPKVTTYDPSKLTVTGDLIHFDAAGQIAHGQGLAQAFMTMPRPSLTITAAPMSVTNGTNLQIGIDLGPAEAGRFYAILGSTTGVCPFPLTGAGGMQLDVPLQPDAYTSAFFTAPGSTFVVNATGVLDASGSATAAFVSPAFNVPGLTPGEVYGRTFYTCLSFDGTGIFAVSNAVSIYIGY